MKCQAVKGKDGKFAGFISGTEQELIEKRERAEQIGYHPYGKPWTIIPKYKQQNSMGSLSYHPYGNPWTIIPKYKQQNSMGSSK